MNKNFYFFTVTENDECPGSYDLRVYKNVLRWPYDTSKLMEQSIGFALPATLIHYEECGMEINANKLGRAFVRNAIREDREKAAKAKPSLL